MKLVLATKNRDKEKEIQNYLRGLAVEIVPLSVVFSPGGIQLKEEGQTLRENALSKARTVVQATGQWALADDTGLFVEALKGAPGIHSARYAGSKATYQQNVEKLLAEMKKIPADKRGAEFACVMALVHPDGREVVVESRLVGEITETSQGKGGFGYDPVFWIPKYQKTLAELSLEEKNRISHRGQSLYKMKSVLETLIEVEKVA